MKTTKPFLLILLAITIFVYEFSIIKDLFATEQTNSEFKVASISGDELGIAEVILAAEQASPELKAAAAREAQAHNDIEIGKSYYYPTIDAEVIQSYGFPGSNSSLVLGGLMSSPFRSGFSEGFVSRMTLFDLSRDFHLKSTHSLLKATQAQTRITRYQVDLTALRIYFDCVRYRGQMETWQNISDQIDKVVKDVEGFVKTGQHSPVDLMLVQTQDEDAVMTRSAFAKRYQIALRRLTLIMGQSKKEKEIACPTPSIVEESNLATITPGAVSPSIEHAQAIEQVAKNIVGEQSAKRLPTFKALASVGAMDRARLVDRNEYSVGFGVTLPLFEGFRTTNEISRAKNVAAERNSDLLSARLDLDEINTFYDEVIESSRIKLQFLDHELKVAQEAVHLSKERYLSFEGPLVDVREALRDLAGIESQRNDVRVDLLLALSAKILINGGHVERHISSNAP